MILPAGWKKRAFKSAWMAGEGFTITSMWSGSDGRLNTRKFICTNIRPSGKRGNSYATISGSTTKNDSIHLWDVKLRQKSISGRR